MKLQRFIGKNTKTVLDEIRATLGEDALIVSNTKIGSKTEIIAAREEIISAAQDQTSALRPSMDETPFSAFMEKSDVIHSDRKDDDPWLFLKNIQTEIQQIKSTISELPISHSQRDPESGLEAPVVPKLMPEESRYDRVLNSPLGIHIIWGERRSGKTSLIKEVLSGSSTEAQLINLVRLPHLYSFCDPFLAELAARHDVNLTYVNSKSQDWSPVINNEIDERLTIIEADLSMISNFQDRTHPIWTLKAQHYSLVADEDQSHLIAELFKNLGVETLTRF